MIVTKSSPVVLFVSVLVAAGKTNEAAAERKVIFRHCVPGSQQRMESVAAVVTKPTNAFGKPGERVVAHFGLRNVNGVRTVFGVVGRRVDSSCRATWLHIQLPIRPNGATGWVRADHVETWPVPNAVLTRLFDRAIAGTPVLIRK